jgi:hypothetical protein
LVALIDAVGVARPGQRGRPRKRFDHLTADKAYGSKVNRRSLRTPAASLTPSQSAMMSWPAAPAAAPAVADRQSSPSGTRTNQIERALNRLKQFRAVATRYDKLRDRYHATVTISSIMIWLRAKPDRDRP